MSPRRPGFVVAVDGPAASGKGTIATALGRALGLPVLDSGLLYRAVGVAAFSGGIDLDDAQACGAIAQALDPAQLDNPALRTREAGEAASRVAVYPQVRESLLSFQRTFAAQCGGAVLDGRDIGTVIAPAAPAKLFVTASSRVRAHRRWEQLTGLGENVSLSDVVADIEARDTRDQARTASPLRMAADAVLLDTTDLTIDEAFEAARRIVETARIAWASPDR